MSGVERVAAFLREHGLEGRVVCFEEGATKTSQLAAAALGCDLGQVVKSLVFVAGEQPVLALVAGDRRADATAIAREMGASSAKLADPGTVRSATGYDVGGVSPFDLPDRLAVLVDDSLTRFDRLFVAAGTPQSMAGLDAATFRSMVGGRMARISQ